MDATACFLIGALDNLFPATQTWDNADLRTLGREEGLLFARIGGGGPRWGETINIEEGQGFSASKTWIRALGSWNLQPVRSQVNKYPNCLGGRGRPRKSGVGKSEQFPRAAGLSLHVLLSQRTLPGEQGLMHKDLWFQSRCGWGAWRVKNGWLNSALLPSLQ